MDLTYLPEIVRTLIFALLAGVGAYLWVYLHRPKLETPEKGASMKLRGPAGMYRSRFLTESSDGWWIHSVIRIDRLGELKIGDVVAGEAVFSSGVIRFQSQVLRMEHDSMLIAKPEWTSKRDRRDEPRQTYTTPLPAFVEACDATVIDLSTLGARVRSDLLLRRGERVHFEIREHSTAVDAWVLAATNGETRLRFESPISLVRS